MWPLIPDPEVLHDGRRFGRAVDSNVAIGAPFGGSMKVTEKKDEKGKKILTEEECHRLRQEYIELGIIKPARIVNLPPKKPEVASS